MDGVQRLAEHLLDVGQARLQGVAGLGLAAELAIRLGGGHDLVHGGGHVVDGGLLRFRGCFGGRLDHCLNAGGDNQQLLQQSLQRFRGGFIHWWGALGWGLRVGGGRQRLGGEALEEGGQGVDQALLAGSGWRLAQRAEFDRGGEVRGLAGLLREVEFLGADAGR
ncbi:hypothetical protein D3C80_1202340 [compost metagenome]